MKKIIILATIALMASCKSESTFDATGTFEATEVVISAEGNGRILSFDIEEGDNITAGNVVGIIDTMQLYYTAQQLKSKLRSVDILKPDIEKQIAVLKEQLSTARTELKRAKNLVAANAGNQKTVDDLTNQIAFINSQIAASRSTLTKSTSGADAEVEAMQYQLMAINDALQKCRIVAHTRGTVLQKYVQQGEMATIGKPLFKIADLSVIYLRAYITADQLSSVALNGTVEVTTDNDKSYQGKITWISDKAEFTPKGVLTKDERANLVYAIKVAVVNDGLLKIGQYGELKL
ncbi:MAG: HlyD family efflux transporter periplasmic adaptor subunit [Rikenellaceae bacterium]